MGHGMMYQGVPPALEGKVVRRDRNHLRQTRRSRRKSMEIVHERAIHNSLKSTARTEAIGGGRMVRGLRNREMVLSSARRRGILTGVGPQHVLTANKS